MKPVLVLLLGLGGCAQIDPYTRTGMWQPSGANDRNLDAMAADPADLLRGRGSHGAQSDTAAAAVRRLLDGTPTPLPSLSADATPGAGAAAAAPAPAPAPAAPGGTN